MSAGLASRQQRLPDQRAKTQAPVSKVFDIGACPWNKEDSSETCFTRLSMTSGAPDPFAEDEPQGPVPFAIGFRKSSGEAIVFGGALLGAGLLLPALLTGHQLLALSALIPLLTAFWHYPMIDRSHPQLGANGDGLFVERLGFLDWGAVTSLELRRTAVRNIELVTLAIGLTRPVEEAVSKPQAVATWKRLMLRNWTREAKEDGNSLLLVRLDTLTGNPEDVLNRIRSYRPV